MNKLNIQPIPNEAALFIKEKKTLVVADLHIGIETELRDQGLHVSSKTYLMKNRLVNLCKKYKPVDIFLLGDIKHTIPSTTIQERKDVKNFLESLLNFCTIHIIPGNHDGNIGRISPSGLLIHPSDGFIFEDVGFVHGHRWPKKEIMETDLIIIGHTHPTVMLTDRLGYKSFEPCWLKGKIIADKLMEKYQISYTSTVLVMPAFNPLCGGASVNRDGVMGPFGKIIDILDSQVYLLNGTSLGKVKDIK